jgi:hypothetical protein
MVRAHVFYQCIPDCYAKRSFFSGGGIGGLSLAHMLSKFAPDIQVDIYEATDEYSHVGAGLTLTERARTVVAGLGLEAGIVRIGGELNTERREYLCHRDLLIL